MTDVTESIGPPSRVWLALEGRAFGELATTWATMPLLTKGPEGDGHPVLVLPGFLASDISTGPLRSFLEKVHYSTHPWRQGRNLGPTGSLEDRLLERLETLYMRYEKKVSLIGWSLGGIYARLLAHRLPHAVRSVITLGSPFNHTQANHAWWLFEWFSGTRVDNIEDDRMDKIRRPPPVPSTAIYSRTDGVAAWQSCVDHIEAGRRTENIEVTGSHCGLGCNPLVFHAIADRLAQPEGRWRPFQRTGARRLFFPKPQAVSNGHGANGHGQTH